MLSELDVWVCEVYSGDYHGVENNQRDNDARERFDEKAVIVGGWRGARKRKRRIYCVSRFSAPSL